MAGRPPKKTTTETQTTQDNTLQKENQELKSQLAEMKKMMESLMASQQKQSPSVEIQYDTEDIPDIPMNKMVKVMSLFSGGLNLKTSNDSTAQIFRFEYVGQVFSIIYSDLVKIIALQRNFFKDGYCMILDKNVVKAHYLEEDYNKFIDAKVINNILDYEIPKIKEIFSNTLPLIQQTIVDIVIQKINNNDYVDKNKVSALSEVYGRDIYELAIKMR